MHKGKSRQLPLTILWSEEQTKTNVGNYRQSMKIKLSNKTTYENSKFDCHVPNLFSKAYLNLIALFSLLNFLPI